MDKEHKKPVANRCKSPKISGRIDTKSERCYAYTERVHKKGEIAMNGKQMQKERIQLFRDAANFKKTER